MFRISADKIVAELMQIADETWDYAGFVVALIGAGTMKKFVGEEESVVVVRIPGNGFLVSKGGKEQFDSMVDKIKTQIDAVRLRTVNQNGLN